MRGRRLRWAVVATLAVLLLATGAVVFWLRPSRATPTNYERLQIGMTLAEAETILGPGGDFTTGPMEWNEPEALVGPGRIWWTDTWTFAVTLDASSRVEYKWVERARRLPQGPIDIMLWRAKRQWRRWFPEG